MKTRQLGFWMCTALVIGNTIGMGIFMQPAALAPYGFNALYGWAAVVVGCACLAVVFANLARRLAREDGPFGYIRSTLGEPVAFPALWCYWISVWVTNAAIAVALVGYVITVFPAFQRIHPSLLAVGLIWLFVGVNCLGVRTGGRVQVVTTLLKLTPLVLVIGLGALTMLTDPQTFTQNVPATPFALSGMMAASSIALFAMLGIESATVPAGQVIDPERTIPRATLVGTLVVAAVYIAIVTIGILVVPQDTLAASDAPFVLILDSLLGAGMGKTLGLLVVVSGVGALNGWTLLAGELTRTLASHRLLPQWLGQMNSRVAPANALLVTGLLATGVALLNYHKSLVAGFTFLAVLTTAANLPLYLGCSGALLYLWRKDPASVPRNVWLFGVGGAAFAVFAFVGVGLEPFLWAVALASAGLPIYYWMRRQHPDPLPLSPRP